MKDVLLILGILCVWISGHLFGVKYTIEKLVMENPQQVIQMAGKSYRISVTEIKQ